MLTRSEPTDVSRDRLVDLRKEAQSQATIIFLVSARDENSGSLPEHSDRCDVIPQDDLHQLVRTVRRAMVEKIVGPEGPTTPKPQDGVMKMELHGLLHFIQDDSSELLSAPTCNARALKKARQLKQAADHTVRLMQQLLDLQPPPGQQP